MHISAREITLRTLTRGVMLGLIIGASNPAAAQTRWRLTHSVAADRWFDSMARLRLSPGGSLAWYGLTRGAVPSWQPDAARAITLEVLHFAPLYYPSASPSEFASAIRAGASGATAPTARASFLVAVLGATIVAPTDRALLASIGAFAESSATPTGVSAERLTALQAIWDSVYAPALAPFLRARKLEGGLLMVVPALGPEGRIFEGRPDDTGDNVIAVTDGARSTIAEAPLLAAVRELCASLVTTTLDRVVATPGGPKHDAAAATRASVRCGAKLIERSLPSRIERYHLLWSQFGGATSFDAAFPPLKNVDSAIDVALQEIFARSVTSLPLRSKEVVVR
jgi:hypothetical protein